VRVRRGWWIFFGLIGLIAGIVVVAVPTTSVTVLAVLVGIWFIVTGVTEIVVRGSKIAEPVRAACDLVAGRSRVLGAGDRTTVGVQDLAGDVGPGVFTGATPCLT
jgi:hypothetical protein